MDPKSWAEVLEQRDAFVGRDLEFKEAYDGHIFRGPIHKIVGVKLGHAGMIQFHLSWTATKGAHMPWTLVAALYPGIELNSPLVLYKDGSIGYEFPSEEKILSSWGKILTPGDTLRFDDLAPMQKIALS